jgi:hypothetical protein
MFSNRLYETYRNDRRRRVFQVKGVFSLGVDQRVASVTRRSRSRSGRLPSSASRVGNATMRQCRRSPRRQPETIVAGFVSDANPRDRIGSGGGVITPPV